MKTFVRSLLIVPVIAVFAAGFLMKTTAQKRGDSFSHRTAAHARVNCNSCHKVPTANWQSVRQFPDVADYPDHDSCIQCHRDDFFRSNRPAICAICHVNVSPRGEARFVFPLRSRSQEFSTIFPHNAHQDIIAGVQRKYDVAVAHFVTAKFETADDPPQFNNCTICHKTADGLPPYATRSLAGTQPLTEPAADTFTARAEFFKSSPTGHESCFACHYQSQKPVRTDCASCHRLTAPYFASNAVLRYSLKFNHLEKRKNNPGEDCPVGCHSSTDCMSCHIRIAQNSDLRSLTTADVPIITCMQCHANNLNEEIGKREKSIAEKQAVFQCNYCHTPAIGSFKIPSSHRKQ
jgi:hypothetical protein